MIDWVILIIILFLFIRVIKRGYFWKAKDGSKLSFKQFMKRWKDGVEGITPLQQTKTTLWSYPLVLGGIITGMIIMVIRQEWWLLIILTGSLPMSLMGLLSTWQKYKQQKRISDTMKELEDKKPKKKININKRRKRKGRNKND
jgi:hypothetical protein